MALSVVVLLSVMALATAMETEESRETARYYEKDYERNGYGGGGYGGGYGGGGGGYCCNSNAYPNLLDLLVPLLLLGLLFYLISRDNNSSSTTGTTGRKRRQTKTGNVEDQLDWDQIIKATGAYVKTGGLMPCYNYYICTINRQTSRLLPGREAAFLKESSLLLSKFLMNDNRMDNVTMAVLQGFQGSADCGTLFPECLALNYI